MLRINQYLNVDNEINKNGIRDNVGERGTHRAGVINVMKRFIIRPRQARITMGGALKKGVIDRNVSRSQKLGYAVKIIVYVDKTYMRDSKRITR